MSKKKNDKPAVKDAKSAIKAEVKAVKADAKPAGAAPASKLDAKETIKIAVILTLICAIITALLAYTNGLTAAKIAENAALAKSVACTEVLSADEYLPLEDERFADYDVYLAVADGDVSGAVITTASKGYGGEVSVMTGIDMQGRITGVKVLSHGETPGLGANAAKDSFLSQFITPADDDRPESFAVTKDGGTIDAVTAATRSSRAVSNAVNEAVSIFEELLAAEALTLPEGYQPPEQAVASATDAPTVTTAPPVSDADGNGEADTVPTVVAGGVTNG